MNGFASIRFDRALDENERSLVTQSLASRNARATSWARAGRRTYAIVPEAPDFDAEFARSLGATIDDPARLVLQIHPVVSDRARELERAVAGPGRPACVLASDVVGGDVVVELQPSARALVLVLALVDETLAATPGRTVRTLLPIADDVLAEYASLRLRESDLTVSRVLERYVESLLQAPGAHR